MCNECPQKESCGLRGSPSVALDNKFGHLGCFFYVCYQDGLRAARRAYYSSQGAELLQPFGTEHKPFRDRGRVVGRFVALRDDGADVKRGCVYVLKSGECVQIRGSIL